MSEDELLKAEYAKVQDDLAEALGMQIMYKHKMMELLLRREKLRASIVEARHGKA